METRYVFRSHLFLPLVIIGVGSLFLLENLGYLDASGILHTWWPSLIILLGLSMFCSRGAGFFFPGVVLLCGAALQLGKLDLLPGDTWSYIWPALLVLLGLSMLFRRTSGGGRCSTDGPLDLSGDRLDLSASFSDTVRRVTSSSFSGGKVVCSFGECTVDLTPARMAGGRAVLHVDVKFGQIRLRVPTTCQVVVKANATAGEIKDLHARPADNTSPDVLEIEGSVTFGGLEITN
jgi:hypothetical protein